MEVEVTGSEEQEIEVFKEGSWDDGRGGFLDTKEVALIKLSTF